LNKRRLWLNFLSTKRGEDQSLKKRASQITEKNVLVSKLGQTTVVGVSEPEEPYRVAKIVISRTGNSAVDASRINEVHQLLSSCPGPDRFCFLIRMRGEPLQLDFPNDTTILDDIMIDQLKSLNGVESVQISMNL
jgi:hypothetical protein